MKLKYFVNGLSPYEKVLVKKVFTACKEGRYVDIPPTKKFKIRFTIKACLAETTQHMTCASDWDVLDVADEITETIANMVNYSISPKISEVFLTFESGIVCSIIMEKAIVTQK